MPYDPALPANGSKLSSAEMRAQLTGLKELIDAVPAGPPGEPGSKGEQGPPFAQAVVDGVATLDPGMEATVDVTFDGVDVHLSFGIPQGHDGVPGEQGPPGEVTAQQLSDAVAGTSGNSDGVALLNLLVSDPPSQGEAQSIANKLDELILALRRV